MSKVVRQRAALVTALVFVGGLLLGVAGSAGATATPTIAQVQHKLNQLESKLERLDQQLDQAKQELDSTNQQLKLVYAQLKAGSREFDTMRAQVARIAVTAYEDGNLNTSIELLVSGNPQEILNQSSILLELSDVNNAQIGEFLSDARHLTATQELAKRTQLAILQMKANLQKRKATLNKLAQQEEQLLAELSPAQRTGTGPGGTAGNPPPYKGPTGTQADTAVQYAYNQVGCPYVYGGTGPCDDGFDCSGLTMEAWAHAGVSIPRTSYEQWDDLPHVSVSDMEPGDIMVFNDAGHVGIYVGDDKLIDAPQPGMDVELISFSGWYRETFDGAVRP
jgi:peptidoglycan DL-endopeptidase CwlO